MFRYEVGATILVKRFENADYEPTKVKILSKAPNTIEAEVLSDGWFRRGSVHILTSDTWYSVGRMP